MIPGTLQSKDDFLAFSEEYEEERTFMNIDDYKRILSPVGTEKLKERLADVLGDIQFCESIYETGGKLNHFSKEFGEAAYKERQELCQCSSAIYSILREREQTT